MKRLLWSDNYLLGCELVDEQHQELFKIANRAFSATMDNEKIPKIKSIVHELIEYTKVHFKDEEYFMKRINYPDLQEHQKIHENIIKSMNKFFTTINKKAVNELEKDLAHFIDQWFISHIIYEDKKVARWAYLFDAQPSMEWKNIYKIGNEELDQEHKYLFEIINDFYTTSVVLSRKEHILETVATLRKYLQAHFIKEEAFMLSLNFNEIKEHKELHVNLLRVLNELAKKENLEYQTLYNFFIAFIERELFEHLHKEDAKIKNWIAFLSEVQETKELKERD